MELLADSPGACRFGMHNSLRLQKFGGLPLQRPLMEFQEPRSQQSWYAVPLHMFADRGWRVPRPAEWLWDVDTAEVQYCFLVKVGKDDVHSNDIPLILKLIWIEIVGRHSKGRLLCGPSEELVLSLTGTLPKNRLSRMCQQWSPRDHPPKNKNSSSDILYWWCLKANMYWNMQIVEQHSYRCKQDILLKEIIDLETDELECIKIWSLIATNRGPGTVVWNLVPSNFSLVTKVTSLVSLEPTQLSDVTSWNAIWRRPQHCWLQSLFI